jgi:hypothetical protein
MPERNIPRLPSSLRPGAMAEDVLEDGSLESYRIPGLIHRFGEHAEPEHTKGIVFKSDIAG